MWSLKLRQAEVAIRDGRLDEAYELLRTDEVRAHRRGQELTTQLVERLKQRVAEHFAASRIEAALRDCERAITLGGNQVDLAALQRDLVAELNQQRDAEAFRRHIHRQALKKVACGDLSLGHNLCQRLPETDDDRHQLSAEIEMKRQAVEKVIARTRAALARGAIEDAVEALKQARSLAAHHETVRELVQQTVQEIVAQARDDFDAGRLDRGRSWIEMASPLVDQHLELAMLSDILRTCHEAAAALDEGNFSVVRERLRMLGNLMPQSPWIESAVQQSDQALGAAEALRTGPLSQLRAMRVDAEDEPMRCTPITSRVGRPPGRMLIQVDGGGRCLAFLQPSVRLGRSSQQSIMDVALQGGPSIREIIIERKEDDYFISSSDRVYVNDQATHSRLLNNGDQILIGSRCGIKFRLPCPASRTAVLQISGTRLDPPDVRQVIMIDDAILIGPDAQCHLRVRQLRRRFVVMRQANRLTIQPPGMDEERQIIEPGRAVRLAGVSLRIHDCDRTTKG